MQSKLAAPLSAALLMAALLMPTRPPLPRRDVNRDLAALQQAECEYRGIKATFDEVTRVYVLQVFADGELVGWEAQPDPRLPETDALVTAVFRVRGPKAGVAAPTAEVATLRQAAGDQLRVQWHYGRLASLRIDAANPWAADALAEFRRTVDGFMARMVVVQVAATLRQGPAANQPAVAAVTAGTVLLREPGSDPAGTWVQVRVPSSPTIGWVEMENVKALDDAR